MEPHGHQYATHHCIQFHPTCPCDTWHQQKVGPTHCCLCHVCCVRVYAWAYFLPLVECESHVGGHLVLPFIWFNLCLVVEVVLKTVVFIGGWRLPWLVSGPLAIRFMFITSFWLFFPSFLQFKANVQAFEEYVVLGQFLKNATQRIFLGYVWNEMRKDLCNVRTSYLRYIWNSRRSTNDFYLARHLYLLSIIWCLYIVKEMLRILNLSI